MLPLYILSKCNIRPSNGILFQWINVSARLYSSSSSSSSSSDSSDSDSDTEKEKPKATHIKSASPATSDNKYDLESLLNNMIQTRKVQKTIDVAMQSKKKSKDKSNKHVPFEKKIISAAEDVANTLGGDKTKTTSDLLEKVLASRMKTLRKEQTRIEMQKNAKFEQSPEQNTQKSSQNKHSEKKSIIQSLQDEFEMQKNAKFKQSPEQNAQESSQNKHSEKKSIIQSLQDEFEMQKNAKFEQLPEKNAQESSQNKHSEKKSIIQSLLDEFEMQKNAKFEQLPEQNVQESSQNKHSEKKSIIQSLLDEYNKQPVKKTEEVEDSVSRKLLKSKMSKNQLQEDEITDKKEPRASKLQNINLWNGKPSHIFENMSAASSNIPELKTWAALEQRELKALTTHPPANIFQELILWTEQGKLWKFPIDNEQGMEEEHNVHFSDHVFMERHLKGWCPTSGPIRHFMELVCIGLSKNPYLTVQEKIGHIMWYREYFESKQDLLQELGAIQEPFPDKIKEITK